MKFLFLYTELADYFLNCCKELSQHGEVHIVRWPVNKEAPFNFNYGEKIKVYDKNDQTLAELEALIGRINPSLIVCAGWIDKDYLRLTKPYFGHIPTIMTCDTHWRGDLKQKLATVFSKLYLRKIFSHIWVPGKIQETYAKKLGFTEKNILTNFYCCDLNRFNAVYERTFEKKKNTFPKKFIYIGRYYDFKGITDAWQAFTELCAEQKTDWELYCLGTGSIAPIQHPQIKHFGFVQPKELEPILEESGVFILPSRFEPWGVVVQECAAAGFPLLLSTAVGAAECFLTEDKNGYTFDKENVAGIKNTLKRILSLSHDQLVQMGERSHANAQKASPKIWAQTLVELAHAKPSN
jgi:glycosyltransferase involved in cell wall biosynthesis